MNIIEFPKLGLEFNINPVALSFDKIDIYWYGIIIATAFVLAVLLSMRDSRKFGVDEEDLIDVILFAAPVAIIFARLYYVVFSWSNFRNNLSEIYKVWHGGLAIYGAVIGAILTAIVFSRFRKINVFKLFDIVAPYLLMAQGIGRWGNFINQEAFGGNTDLPWGMTGNNIVNQLKIYQLEGLNIDPALPVHPTFLYESLWNFAGFAFLMWFRKRKKVKGEVFFQYMILYGVGRFWIEGLRLDSLWIGPFRVSQVLALLFVVVFALLIILRRRNFNVKAEQMSETGDSEYGNILKSLKMEEENSDRTDDDEVLTEKETSAEARTETEETEILEENSDGFDEKNEDEELKEERRKD